jgi:5-(carboxyamino)imidazole ribonucleotide synthase
MWNLLGRDWSTDWLAVPGCDVHWYDKEIRPGRKVGHVNLNLPSHALLQDSLNQLAALLPEDDRSPLLWALQEIQADSPA